MSKVFVGDTVNVNGSKGEIVSERTQYGVQFEDGIFEYYTSDQINRIPTVNDPLITNDDPYFSLLTGVRKLVDRLHKIGHLFDIHLHYDWELMRVETELNKLKKKKP